MLLAYAGVDIVHVTPASDLEDDTDAEGEIEDGDEDEDGEASSSSSSAAGAQPDVSQADW